MRSFKKSLVFLLAAMILAGCNLADDKGAANNTGNTDVLSTEVSSSSSNLNTYAENAHYVAKTGSDSNNGTSWDDAWLTIGYALTRISGGETLIIGDGTYDECLIDTIPSGSSGSPTIIQAANRNMAILAPTSSPAEYVIRLSGLSYITIDGIVTDAGSLKNCAGIGTHPTVASNIVIKNGTMRNGKGTFGSGIDGLYVNSLILNNDIYNNGETAGNAAHGIYFQGHDTIIDGNRCYGNDAYGIVIFQKKGSGADNNIVRNNVIYSNTLRSLGVFTGNGNLIYNNIIHDGPTHGINVDQTASNTKVYNNTIYNNSGNGILIGGSTNMAKNNIIMYNR